MNLTEMHLNSQQQKKKKKQGKKVGKLDEGNQEMAEVFDKVDLT